MAESSECRMRLHEYRDIGGAILGNLPGHIKAAEPQLLDIHVVGMPADAAGFSEIDPPTSVFAETTAVAIETISSSGDDGNEAGDHLQGLNIIGINGSNKMVTVQNLATTAAWSTFQLELETWKNIFKCYGSKWGTGDDDPAGAVDVRKIDDTVIVELVAGDNEGNGCRFVVPEGHCCMLMDGRLKRMTALAVDEGVRIRIVYIDEIDALLGAAADRALNWIEFAVGGYERYIDIHRNNHVFEENTQIILQHSSLTDAGEDYDLHLHFLIWRK